jgi:hypothetical protein
MDINSVTIYLVMNGHLLNRGITIIASTVLVTTLMMMTAPSIYAASPDLTIDDDNFGIDGDGNPFLTVKGTAGGTIPEETGDIYAYVFDTNDGMYAVTSHTGIEDSDEVEDDADWHAHKVQLNDENCVTGLEEDGNAELDGKTVTVEDTDATELNGVLIAVLSAEKKGAGDDDTGEDDTSICVVKVFSQS